MGDQRYRMESARSFAGAAGPAAWTGVDWLLLALAALGTCALLMFRLGDAPIQLYDEALLANNALEMLSSGDLLVTRAGDLPDLHNVKPPMMIWLMSASIHWFGANEFAVRLPAVLAAAMTVALVYAFTRTVSGSRPTGLAASLTLLATAGYVGPHVASTGDYDGLLVLFTTASVASFYFYLEAARAKAPRARYWAAALALAVIGGILTKGVAGVAIAPGLLLYSLWRGALPDLLTRRDAWIALSAILLATLAYYGLREAAAPGYIQAVLYSDFVGRATEDLEGLGGPPTYYIRHLLRFWPLLPHPADWVLPTDIASAMPWTLIAPVAALAAGLSPNLSCRRAAVLLALLSASFLATISAMQTKLPWYQAPLYPWLAIMTALGVGAAIERLAVLLAWPRLPQALFPIVLAVTAVGAGWIETRRLRQTEQASNLDIGVNGALIRRLLQDRGGPPLRFVNDGYERGTFPPIADQFYAKVARMRGRDARVVTSNYVARPGELVLWCPPNVKASPKLVGDVIGRRNGCQIVRVTARAPHALL